MARPVAATPGPGGRAAPTSGADTVSATEDVAVQISVSSLLANGTGSGTLTNTRVARAVDGATATDVDSSVIAYSFAKDSPVLHDDWFQIDPSSGVVTVFNSSKLDYETASSQQFSIYARDGSLGSGDTR